jgi:hypothetical protein
MIALLVYSLCAITSIACTVLLARGYLQSRERLLLWSAACFAALSLNNILLIVNTQLAGDLSIVRAIPAVIGVMILVVGLIWDSHR